MGNAGLSLAALAHLPDTQDFLCLQGQGLPTTPHLPHLPHPPLCLCRHWLCGRGVYTERAVDPMHVPGVFITGGRPQWASDGWCGSLLLQDFIGRLCLRTVGSGPCVLYWI